MIKFLKESQNLETLTEGKNGGQKVTEKLPAKAVRFYEHMFKWKYYVEAQDWGASDWSRTIYGAVDDFRTSEAKPGEINDINNGKVNNDGQIRVPSLFQCYERGRDDAQDAMKKKGCKTIIPKTDTEIFDLFGTFNDICDIDKVKNWLYTNAKCDKAKYSATYGYETKMGNSEEDNKKGNRRSNRRRFLGESNIDDDFGFDDFDLDLDDFD